MTQRRRNFNNPARHRAVRGPHTNPALTTPGYLMPREVPFQLAVMCRIGDRQFTHREAWELDIPLPLPVTVMKPHVPDL